MTGTPKGQEPPKALRRRNAEDDTTREEMACDDLAR